MPAKKTQIIATIGPASSSKETLLAMAHAGMDIVRLNSSWGSYDEHHSFIATIREVATESNKPLPIIFDLSGPRVSDNEEHHMNEEVIKTITDKDKQDIVFASKEQVEYFALSYVRSKEDILELKALLKESGSTAKIIAKIETKEAVEHIRSIAQESDMIMIARGDLGNVYPLEEIPFIEMKLLTDTKELGVPAIVATQVLLSMTENSAPSRAEVTDEVVAITHGAYAVMLSEETARGKHPIQAVEYMNKIAINAEHHRDIVV